MSRAVQTESRDIVVNQAAAERRQQLLWFVERFGLVLIFVAIVIYFGFAASSAERFMSLANARAIVGSQAVPAIAALALMIPLVGGHFDLSIGAVLGLSSIVTAAAISRFDAPVLVAAVIAIAISALIGLINGLLVTRIGVNSLITTLGIATIIGGIVQWYTGGQAILAILPKSFSSLGTGTMFGIPKVAFILLAVSICLWYLLAMTPFGRYLESVGSNPAGAKLVGIDVDMLVLISFVLSSSIAGAAGVLHLSRVSAGNPQSGPNFLLPALSAAYLGATVFRPGHFNVPGTVLAVYFVAASVSGLVLAGAESWVDDVFQGASLVIAVGVSTIVARRREAER